MVLADYRLEGLVQFTREDHGADEECYPRLWWPSAGDDEPGLRPEAGSLQRWLDLSA